MREAMEKKLFKGFSIGRNNVEISILQYADDTIFFGETSMENVKAIKVILWSFKLYKGSKLTLQRVVLG